MWFFGEMAPAADHAIIETHPKKLDPSFFL
jgi:hypothetical protein